MSWENIGKLSYQFALSIIEWGFKICALIAATLALATNGSFGNKIAKGFGSLPEGIREIFAFSSSFWEMSWVAREYHQIGGAEFQQAYGMAPLNQLITSLSGYFTFFHTIFSNLSESPFISIVAALIVFFCFYILARIIRFARQRGKGSYLNRMEQQLGDRVFNRRERLKEKVREFTQRRAAQKRMGQSSPELT